ncbi:hypothetical protein AB0J43_31325 [Nonomuraea fuscirosea]
MTYFRVKWRRLPAAYRHFLQSSLAPGATLVVVDCQLRWPTTSVGPRYVFQHGALGGATRQEYEHGSRRVADYLHRYGVGRSAWDYPPADGDSPEAEWGFEPELLADLAELAQRHRWRLVRLRFAEPEDLSPAVADLYRTCYAQRGLPGDRLLVECFLLLEPWWALRSGSVPYWMVFNTDQSHARLMSYLDGVDAFDEIRLMLFSHGVDSVGLAPAQAWRQMLARAGKVGVFTGVEAGAYPRDFASLARAHRELARIMTTYPMPLPLGWPWAEEFLAKRDRLECDDV